MFVQIISGQVSDPEGFRRQSERWDEELRPGASGYLGTTAGVTDEGTGFVLARFESEEAARANSDRPEQGQWWAETEKCFSSPPSFEESSDTETFFGGGSNDAGFVQIMRARVADRAKLAEADRGFEEQAAELRPDIIGGVRAWTAPDAYVEAAYFTSEEAARAGEAAEPPPEVQAMMAEWRTAVPEIEYLDLREPWLR